MPIVPLDAVLHFDLHAAILGWQLTAAQPKLQHPRHNYSPFFMEQRGNFSMVIMFLEKFAIYFNKSGR
jgi:hypothetical protein